MRHGTAGAYNNHGCRCPDCREAHRDYRRARRAEKSGQPPRLTPNEQYLADLLRELCPDGLTDDCPARRGALQEAA